MRERSFDFAQEDVEGSMTPGRFQLARFGGERVGGSGRAADEVSDTQTAQASVNIIGEGPENG